MACEAWSWIFGIMWLHRHLFRTIYGGTTWNRGNIEIEVVFMNILMLKGLGFKEFGSKS